MDVFTEFTFEAAHSLPHVPDRLQVRPACMGIPSAPKFWVQGDIGLPPPAWSSISPDIKAAFSSLHNELDHHYLNEVKGLDNPTSENLARWIWERLRTRQLPVAEVVVRETCTLGVAYRGDGEDPARRPERSRDHRGLAIDDVGISEFRHPLSVYDVEHGKQETIANVSLSVALPADRRGSHLSRFVESPETHVGELSPDGIVGAL